MKCDFCPSEKGIIKLLFCNTILCPSCYGLWLKILSIQHTVAHKSKLNFPIYDYKSYIEHIGTIY